MLPASGGGHGRGGRGGAFSGDDHEARGSAEALEFLANDLLCRGVDGEGEHLFADAGHFDAQACGFKQPGGDAEQLRGGLVAGIDEGAADGVAEGVDGGRGRGWDGRRLQELWRERLR